MSVSRRSAQLHQQSQHSRASPLAETLRPAGVWAPSRPGVPWARIRWKGTSRGLVGSDPGARSWGKGGVMRLLRRWFAPLALVTVLGGLAASGWPAGRGRHHPSWRHLRGRAGQPTRAAAPDRHADLAASRRFQSFSAPMGQRDSGYVGFGETMEALLPAPNSIPARPGVGPGAAHQPPYDDSCRWRGRAGLPRRGPFTPCGVLQRQRRLAGVDKRCRTPARRALPPDSLSDFLPLSSRTSCSPSTCLGSPPTAASASPH